MAAKLSDEERQRIIDLLQEHGGNQNRVARLSNRHQSTVGRIAKAEGIESVNAAPKKANAARRDYAQAERLELLNEGFDKAREILKTVTEPKDLQSWMIAVATAIDKRRLEDGEATNRNENHNTAGLSLEDEFRKIDTKLEAESRPQSVS